jgi:hypothetical protein
MVLRSVTLSRSQLFVSAPSSDLLPFAGTEGFNPVAYAPYVLALAIGNGLGLDFPNILLLMRLMGLITFTAIAAYAIKLTPTGSARCG